MHKIGLVLQSELRFNYHFIINLYLQLSEETWRQIYLHLVPAWHQPCGIWHQPGARLAYPGARVVSAWRQVKTLACRPQFQDF